MEDFFASFQKQLIHAVHMDVTALIRHIGSETLYAVALVTDSDAGTVYLGMNTEESLQRRIEYYRKKMVNTCLSIIRLCDGCRTNGDTATRMWSSLAWLKLAWHS